MHAYMLLWYGQEVIDLNDGPLGTVATLPYRWNDGDQIMISNSTEASSFNFIYKRVSPNASAAQFNTADGLVSLVNATKIYAAKYIDVRNDLAPSTLKLMIKIYNTAAGAIGNGAELYVTRFKDPTGPTSTVDISYQNTEQPLLIGQILNNAQALQRYATMQGGCATRVKTFVMSPVVSTERGVWVQGIDPNHRPLAPVVYASDVIPGVGFTVTNMPGSVLNHFSTMFIKFVDQMLAGLLAPALTGIDHELTCLRSL